VTEIEVRWSGTLGWHQPHQPCGAYHRKQCT
jgi:hypothetical protein